MIKVYYMTNDYKWHYCSYPKEQYDNICKKLHAMINACRIKDYKVEK